MKKAFEAASRLPDREQDELATAILEELAADERWDAAFAHSQRALEDHQAFSRGYRRLPEHVQRRAREAYRRFRDNPNHPSLRLQVHAIQPIYAARVGLGYRALALIDGEAVVWFWIRQPTPNTTTSSERCEPSREPRHAAGLGPRLTTRRTRGTRERA